MLDKKKELSNNELDNVSGGDYDRGDKVAICKTCGKLFYIDEAEKVQFDEGCDKYYEYICPHCGALQKCDIFYV